jgi:hypothetical protein
MKDRNEKIHLRAKKAAYLLPGQAAVIRIKPEVYNRLVDIANETTSSIGSVASEIIRQAIENELIVFDKEE